MTAQEALGNNNIPAEWETRAICEIMNTGISRGDIQGWQAHKTAKRYSKYGVQKGWERVTSPETGAFFSEITDAEAQQLGFPSDEQRLHVWLQRKFPVTVRRWM